MRTFFAFFFIIVATAALTWFLWIEFIKLAVQ